MKAVTAIILTRSITVNPDQADINEGKLLWIPFVFCLMHMIDEVADVLVHSLFNYSSNFLIIFDLALMVLEVFEC